MSNAENLLSASERRQLLDELAALEADFKASVVAAELVESAVSQEAIFFRNISTFRRPVSKDIARIAWNDDDDLSAQLIFDLHREGIYDMLPEAVVHAPIPGKKKDAELDVKRGVILKQEERAARKFFAPIENEFAHRSLYLDILEREILRMNNPQRTRQFFEYFFGDSRILSDHQILVLIYILPLSHKIRSNPRLIELAMSKILAYEVNVESKLEMQTHQMTGGVPALGMSALGIDSVLNDHFCIAEASYVLTVRAIPTKEYKEFIGSGHHANVMAFVAGYFFPADAKLTIQLECAYDEKEFSTSSEERHSYLNFNAYI